jgi:hypothetical protein
MKDALSARNRGHAFDGAVLPLVSADTRMRSAEDSTEDAKVMRNVDRAIVAHAQNAAEQLLELLSEKFELYGSDQPRIQHAP